MMVLKARLLHEECGKKKKGKAIPSHAVSRGSPSGLSHRHPGREVISNQSRPKGFESWQAGDDQTSSSGVALQGVLTGRSIMLIQTQRL